MRISRRPADELMVYVERVLKVIPEKPDLAIRLRDVGIDAAALNEGARRVAAYKHANRRLAQCTAERLSATQALQRMHDEVRRTFVMHRTIARQVVPPESGAALRLGLAGRTPRARRSLVDRARRFYTALSTDATQTHADALHGDALQTKIPAAARRHGLSDAVAAEALDRLEAMEAGIERQRTATGAVADARARRREAVAALRQWASDLRVFARLATADRPALFAVFK